MTARKRFVLAAGWLLAARGLVSAQPPEQIPSPSSPPNSLTPPAMVPATPGNGPVKRLMPLGSAPISPDVGESQPGVVASTPAESPQYLLTTPNGISTAPSDMSGEVTWHAPGCSAAPEGIANEPTTDPVTYIFPQDGRLRVRGWLDGGNVWNANNPASKFNGPYNAVDQDQWAGNQAYGILEYVLPQDGSFGIGGRVDVLYGNDFFLAQSIGFETNRDGTKKWNESQYYGLAVPQAYVEVGSKDLNAKLGHFYSIVGYESVMSTENFFYTHSYSYQFGGPFTHWGGLGTWKAGDNWQFQAGLVNGWNELDGDQNRINFLGAVKYTGECNWWWTSFAIITGEQPNNVAGLPGIVPEEANRTRYSFIVDVNVTERLEYVFHHYLGVQADGTPSGGSALWYGIDQYAYYKVTDSLKYGLRFEWFRDQDGTRVGLDRPDNPNKPPLPGSYFSVSLGSNWTPTWFANLTIRPEVRWDWVTDTNGVRPYDDGKKSNQLLAATDMILKF